METWALHLVTGSKSTCLLAETSLHSANTHKWTCFVEFPYLQEPSKYIDKVKFKLTPGFDVVEEDATAPPYSIVREGYDDVHVDIEVHFKLSWIGVLPLGHLVRLRRPSIQIPSLRVGGASRSAAPKEQVRHFMKPFVGEIVVSEIADTILIDLPISSGWRIPQEIIHTDSQTARSSNGLTIPDDPSAFFDASPLLRGRQSEHATEAFLDRLIKEATSTNHNLQRQLVDKRNDLHKELALLREKMNRKRPRDE